MASSFRRNRKSEEPAPPGGDDDEWVVLKEGVLWKTKHLKTLTSTKLRRCVLKVSVTTGAAVVLCMGKR